MLLWEGNNNTIFLFGGYFHASPFQITNDLWLWNGENWHWIKKNVIPNGRGVYGEIRKPANSNWPGARKGSVSWTDSLGNLWLFGGYGYDAEGNLGFLNNL